MTRVTYLVCSHTDPEQVLRLATLLSSGGRGSHVVINHDESRSRLDRGAFDELPGVHLLASGGSIEWGSFAIVERVLRSMRWIQDNLEFDWLVLLSGQDYPIQPLPAIESLLGSTGYDGFMSGAPVETLKPRSAREAHRRYYYRYYRVPTPARILSRRLRERSTGQGGAAVRSTTRSPLTVKAVPDGTAIYVGFRRLRTPFTSRFPCYRGGHWCTLSSACVAAVGRFVAEHPEYVRFCRRTRIPDESFLNTILLNDARFDISRDDLRYVRFQAGGAPHPEILSIRDLGPMLASGKHFARKFDAAVDSAILDALDERVHGLRV